MENILKKINTLREKIVAVKESLNIEAKKVQLKDLEFLMNQESFWNDNLKASKISQEAESLNSDVIKFESLENEIRGLEELIALASEYNDNSVYDYAVGKYEELEKRFDDLEFLLLFSENDDSKSALLYIHAGTGGVDAQDWAQILERMYLRYAEKKSFKVDILDRVMANEAGIKNSVLRISGPYAYANFKSENGVHRLVRISPFDAEGMRHTSFAGVEVIPEISNDIDIEINDKDLRIDFYKSSGPGGQSVNTTDSAVRIVHIPSNITAACQSERSQHQNKEKAMLLLKSKLYQLKQDEQDQKNKDIKGSAGQGTWGKQIRSYVFQPYQMVKDHRTNMTVNDIQSVIDGDLHLFVEAYLKMKFKERNK